MLKREDGTLREITDEDDIKFVVELINASTVSVKHIERFIKRRLDELKGITYIEKSQITAINMRQGIVKIESLDEKPSVQQCQFDYIYCADGAAHHAVDVFNEGLKKPIISYKPKAKPAHPYHASAYVTIKRADKQKLELPDKEVVANSSGRTWLLALDIHSKSFVTEGVVKCFFGGEVPKYVFDAIQIRNQNIHADVAIEHVKTATNYIQDVVQSFWQANNLNKGVELKVELVKPSKKWGDNKDKLKLQAFRTEPQIASYAALKIGDKTIMLGGDTFGGANYQFGSGLNNAFKHTRRAGEVYRGKKTVAQYDKECKSISTTFEFATKLTNWCCFKPALGKKIQKAIDGYGKEFLKRHGTLVDQLRSQRAIREREQEMRKETYLDEAKQGIKQPLLSS